MTLRPLVLVGAALALALPAAPARAQAEAGDFVRSLVDAINSKESAQRRALVHTGSLQCENPGQAQVLEEHFERQSRFPIPGTVAWRLSAARPGRPMFADRFDYPVRPTHVLQLDVQGENNESMYVVLQVAREAGLWREVAGCPKLGTVKVDRRVAIAREGGQTKAQLLVSTLAPKRKAELLALLKDGKKADAVRAYQEASLQDVATAAEVIELLEEQLAR